jgi:hypothetical protein
MSLELFLSIAGFAAAILGGFWTLGRMALAQLDKRLDERFAAQERAREEGRRQFSERLARMEENQHRQERELLQLKADLPVHYVRREDYVRSQTVIEAKLDALALRIENLQLRGGRGD